MIIASATCCAIVIINGRSDHVFFHIGTGIFLACGAGLGECKLSIFIATLFIFSVQMCVAIMIWIGTISSSVRQSPVDDISFQDLVSE